MKMQLMNETLRYDILNNEIIYKTYAPQPTSFPNHHTVVGETPHYTLANSNFHQPLISFLYMIPSCKQY